jgi:hypothetical protein
MKQKSVQTCLEKFGTEHPAQAESVKEKARNTCLEKYGTDHPMKSGVVKERLRQAFIDKYGVDNFSKTELFCEMQKEKHANSSKEEDEFYEMLSSIIDTKRQVHTDKYPFNCDFYIPTLDLYIEYQGSQYHGRHPYDEIKDKDKLEELKRRAAGKKRTMYKNMILVWTIKDPMKRQIAKENGVNLIEIWSLKEAKQFCEKLKNRNEISIPK